MLVSNASQSVKKSVPGSSIRIQGSNTQRPILAFFHHNNKNWKSLLSMSHMQTKNFIISETHSWKTVPRGELSNLGKSIESSTCLKIYSKLYINICIIYIIMFQNVYIYTNREHHLWWWGPALLPPWVANGVLVSTPILLYVTTWVLDGAEKKRKKMLNSVQV